MHCIFNWNYVIILNLHLFLLRIKEKLPYKKPMKTLNKTKPKIEIKKIKKKNPLYNQMTMTSLVVNLLARSIRFLNPKIH